MFSFVNSEFKEQYKVFLFSWVELLSRIIVLKTPKMAPYPNILLSEYIVEGSKREF